MITYLRVTNLAIVEEFTIEPGEGLNVLTGETGAGKSLLIDSLELISGGRGSSEIIRSGTDRMTAEAVLLLPADLRHLAGELIESDGDESGEPFELIVKRELTAGGRGRILINGSVGSARELGAAIAPVLQIHGQEQPHERIAGESLREILDRYAGVLEITGEVKKAYTAWREASEQASALERSARDRLLRLDLLRYQIEEISAARLQEPDEEEQLREEKVLLSRSREIVEAASAAYTFIEDDDASAVSQLSRASHHLQFLQKVVREIGEAVTQLEDIRYRLQDLARSLEQLASTVRDDPARLDEIEERLQLLERLRKKYGGSIEAVKLHLTTIRHEHEDLADFDATLDRARHLEETMLETYQRLASGLSSKRQTAAKQFETAIRKELSDLAMERTTIRIAIEVSAAADSRLVIDGQSVAFGPGGYDKVEILIAPNRGEEPKPLRRIASGGELSRIQLAIAAALFHRSRHAGAATLVFDEIDAGIGGRAAEKVGRKLSELAARNQVICVTHLPQIACFGSTHFRVWKEDAEGRTRARIERLDEHDQRVNEIARMLGGESTEDSARAHATELLKAAGVAR